MNLILNIISVVFGLVASVFMIPGIVPLLGWLNWIVLLIAGFGAIIGALAKTKAGLIVNLVVLGIAGLRLFLGGGFV